MTDKPYIIIGQGKTRREYTGTDIDAFSLAQSVKKVARYLRA